MCDYFFSFETLPPFIIIHLYLIINIIIIQFEFYTRLDPAKPRLDRAHFQATKMLRDKKKTGI